MEKEEKRERKDGIKWWLLLYHVEVLDLDYRATILYKYVKTRNKSELIGPIVAAILLKFGVSNMVIYCY